MINFLRFRTLTAFISLSIVLSFIGMAIYHYQMRGQVFSYSIDFTGGTQILLKFDKPVSGVEIKNILEKQGWKGAIIREFSDQEILIRVKEFAGDAQGLGERMLTVIQKNLAGYEIQILQSESVGPGVGAALRWKSVRAVVFALLAMLIYIALRFWSFSFAFGAVVALFHDALVMLALFLFLDREISINVIGAILAVLGYSINDTIVIFSQIRDDLKKMKDSSLATIVNVSLNQTLKRTLLTSISTGIPVTVMLLFGGEALRNFSLALLAGIIFGTYSSIYIASPVMMMFYQTKNKKTM
ncbi:MAG: protein translocase subunit SecF [Candidatus Babeliales bacterium]